MSENKTPAPEKMLYCSFCEKARMKSKLIAGPSVYICDECIDLCNDIIRDELLSPEFGQENGSELPTPKEICNLLDQYVIGQNRRRKFFPSRFTIITSA